MAMRRDIDILNDPILGGIINCLQVQNYQQIKKKARIIIPKSAQLLGVIDSTGTLAPNEVFIQIKRDDFRTSKAKRDLSLKDLMQDLFPRGNSNTDENEESKSAEFVEISSFAQENIDA